MALVRVDYTALAQVASHMQALPQRLATAHQDINTARASTPHIGDAGAAANSDELLRRLAVLVDLTAQVTAGLTRSLAMASGDYATAESVVVRFD